MREQLLLTTVQVVAALAGIVGVPLTVYLVRFFRALNRDLAHFDQADDQARRRLNLSARRAALELDERDE